MRKNQRVTQDQILIKLTIYGDTQLSQMSDQISYLKDMSLHGRAFTYSGME